jgi:hypothetical protein
MAESCHKYSIDWSSAPGNSNPSKTFRVRIWGFCNLGGYPRTKICHKVEICFYWFSPSAKGEGVFYADLELGSDAMYRSIERS